MSHGSATSRLLLVAREDVRDTIRERQAHMLVGLFGFLGAVVAYLSGGGSGPQGEAGLADQVLPLFTFLIPLVALAFVAHVIVNRRTMGALTVILGLPIPRWTVVMGTLVGRSVVVAASVLIGLVVAVPIGIARGTAIDPVPYLAMAVVLVLLVAVFVALAVTISAITTTSTRATVAAFGTYVVFTFRIWEQLPLVVAYITRGFTWPESTPTWAALFTSLNPIRAFSNVLGGLPVGTNGGVIPAPPSEPAFYERPVFAVVVLLGWIAATTAGGVYSFRASDL